MAERILIVEDQPLDQSVIANVATRHGSTIVVDSMEGAVAAVRQSCDLACVILDLSIPTYRGQPRSEGVDTIAAFTLATGWRGPLIVATISTDPAVADECKRQAIPLCSKESLTFASDLDLALKESLVLDDSRERSKSQMDAILAALQRVEQRPRPVLYDPGLLAVRSADLHQDRPGRESHQPEQAGSDVPVLGSLLRSFQPEPAAPWHLAVTNRLQGRGDRLKEVHLEVGHHQVEQPRTLG